MMILGYIIWGFLWLIIGVCMFGILVDITFLDFKSTIVPKIVDIGLKIIFIMGGIMFLVILIGGFFYKSGICK